jgi:hypothetical protein
LNFFIFYLIKELLYSVNKISFLLRLVFSSSDFILLRKLLDFHSPSSLEIFLILQFIIVPGTLKNGIILFKLSLEYNGGPLAGFSSLEGVIIGFNEIDLLQNFIIFN